MLARREHSQLEIQHKLQARDFHSDDIAQVLQEFVEKNWQSDARFAASYLRDRASKGFGPQRIRYELKQRGVEPDAAFDAEPQDWNEQILRLYDRKYGSRPIKDFKDQAKRMRFLQQRGFSHEAIRNLFKRLETKQHPVG